MKLFRRSFMKMTGAGMAAAAVSSPLMSGCNETSRQGIRWNVLLFTSDQHNPHFMNCDNQHPLNVAEDYWIHAATNKDIAVVLF